MKTNHKSQRKYVVPQLEIVPLHYSTGLLEVFTYGDPKGTGIVIDTFGDDSDDDNLSNDAFFDD